MFVNKNTLLMYQIPYENRKELDNLGMLKNTRLCRDFMDYVTMIDVWAWICDATPLV